MMRQARLHSHLGILITQSISLGGTHSQNDYKCLPYQFQNSHLAMEMKVSITQLNVHVYIKMIIFSLSEAVREGHKKIMNFNGSFFLCSWQLAGVMTNNNLDL